MWWVVGYVALLVYAAVVFTFSATRERWSAALGTLLTVTGLQLSIMHSLAPWAAFAIAALGALLIARDVATILVQRATPRAALIPIRVHTHDSNIPH